MVIIFAFLNLSLSASLGALIVEFKVILSSMLFHRCPNFSFFQNFKILVLFAVYIHGSPVKGQNSEYRWDSRFAFSGEGRKSMLLRLSLIRGGNWWSY